MTTTHGRMTGSPFASTVPALIAKDGPSNGIDAWIKRTDKMVIDRWYSELSRRARTAIMTTTERDATVTRWDAHWVPEQWLPMDMMIPCGSGVTLKAGETLDNGSLRTSFRLTYPPFIAR
ncbi:MAG: hypothetical protein MZV63_20285 [Marinilabiliales bacterium]|nr:hypothetical protein [Marinilabiliales bacterium]